MTECLFTRLIAVTASTRAHAAAAPDDDDQALSIPTDPDILVALSTSGLGDLASLVDSYWATARDDRASAFRAHAGARSEIDGWLADMGSRLAGSDPQRAYTGFLFAIESVALLGRADPRPLDAPLPSLLAQILDCAGAMPRDADLIEAHAFSVLDFAARLRRSVASLPVEADPAAHADRRRSGSTRSSPALRAGYSNRLALDAMDLASVSRNLQERMRKVR